MAGRAISQDSHSIDTMPSTTNDPCRFLDLPAELRLSIYKYVFETGQCGLLAAENIYKDIIDSDMRDTALLYTCRLIHIEARAVLLDRTDFTISFWDQAVVPRHHQILRDASVLDHLRNVRLVGALGPSEKYEKVVKSVKEFMAKTEQCKKMRRVQLEFHVAPDNKGGDVDAIVEAFAGVQTQKVVLDEMEGDGVDGYKGNCVRRATAQAGRLNCQVAGIAMNRVAVLHALVCGVGIWLRGCARRCLC